MPNGLPVLGGGNNTYNNDVPKNQMSVGITVYPHAIAILCREPVPLTSFPTTQSNSTVMQYVIMTESAIRINCFVSTKGLNAAVFTNDEIAK